jgi:hypothetical protein
MTVSWDVAPCSLVQVYSQKYGRNDDDCLLGCCAVQSGTSLQIFQRCLLPHQEPG